MTLCWNLWSMIDAYPKHEPCPEFVLDAFISFDHTNFIFSLLAGLTITSLYSSEILKEDRPHYSK